METFALSEPAILVLLSLAEQPRQGKKSYRHDFGEEMKFVFRDARSSLPPALAVKMSF